MTDYQRMYAILCAAASDALDRLSEIEANAEARELLQEALDKAEELYIQSSDDDRAAVAAEAIARFRKLMP